MMLELSDAVAVVPSNQGNRVFSGQNVTTLLETVETKGRPHGPWRSLKPNRCVTIEKSPTHTGKGAEGRLGD